VTIGLVSHLSSSCTTISGTALIASCDLEWYHKDSHHRLHLFKDRSFASEIMLMFMVGFALMSSTVLLPLFNANGMATPADKPASH